MIDNYIPLEISVAPNLRAPLLRALEAGPWLHTRPVAEDLLLACEAGSWLDARPVEVDYCWPCEAGSWLDA